MKKQGFTLMEILGSLVVIAIVAVIIIPITFNVINRVRLNALRDSAYGLLESANLYYAQYQNVKTVRFDKDEETDTLANLHYKGNVKKGTVIIDKRGKVTVCLSDGHNSAYKNYNEKEMTLVEHKTCNIPSNTYVVYLDDDRTLTELSNEELTNIVLELQEENQSLKDSLLDKTYPIGSVYISTTDNTVEKVEARFGGEWVVFGNGRTLLSTIEDSEQTGGQSSTTYTPTGTIGNTTLTAAQSGQKNLGTITSSSSGAHTHSININSGNQSANHTHSVNINTTKSGAHVHSIYSARQYGTGTATDGSTKLGRSQSNADGTAVLSGGGGTTGPIYSAGEHDHNVSGNTGANSANHYHNVSGNTSGASTNHTHTITINGSNATEGHNHTFTGTASSITTMPPYITVYMYKRVA